MAEKETIKVQRGDIIHLDYDLWIAEDNILFETTHKELAEKHEISEEDAVYKPVPLIIDEGKAVQGLYDSLLAAREKCSTTFSATSWKEKRYANTAARAVPTAIPSRPKPANASDLLANMPHEKHRLARPAAATAAGQTSPVSTATQTTNRMPATTLAMARSGKSTVARLPPRAVR